MKYGCVGMDVSRSFSAEIHRRFGNEAYELRSLTPEEMVRFLLKKEYDGLNVTMPYKISVVPFMDELGPEARRTGAVNTVRNRDGCLIGDNTDMFGMEWMIREAGMDLKGKKVLILGTGGTSCTAEAVAEKLGAARIEKVSRSGKNGALRYGDLETCRADTEIFLQTTPCGMTPRDGELPVNPERFPCLCGVIDAVYTPLRTKLVCEARRLGIPAVGGLGMLVAQAAASEALFFHRPVEAFPIEQVRRETERSRENIFLIGMPGSGKTTLGRRLAEALGREWIDTDERITEIYGETPEQILRSYGEEVFRKREKETVRAVTQKTATVISTGGGVILDPENRDALRRSGFVIYLKRTPELRMPDPGHPLTETAEKWKEIYEKRAPLYEATADITVRDEAELLSWAAGRKEQ